MSAIDKLKTLLQERHKFGDHQTLTAAIIELADRVDALQNDVNMRSGVSGAPRPLTVKDCLDAGLCAQSDVDALKAAPLPSDDEDDLPFSTAPILDWRSLEIPKPSHDLSHAIELLTNHRFFGESVNTWQQGYNDAIAILEAQKATPKPDLPKSDPWDWWDDRPRSLLGVEVAWNKPEQFIKVEPAQTLDENPMYEPWDPETRKRSK